MARSALLNVMVAAAEKAGRSLARDFGEVENLQVSRKGPADFVSKADMRAEEIVYRELSKARPSYGFLGEEGTSEQGDGHHRWIVDPLDGTTNFLHGVPIFAVSIALERQGELVAGVVYNPVMDELYVAEKGNGAFMNDRRLRVSARSDLADCLIGTGLPFMGHGNQVRTLSELQQLFGRVAGIRRPGAAALDLAWTAAGRYDGFWEHDLKPWDMAAGIVLVREAGGFVTDASGGTKYFESASIVAGNESVHRSLLKMVADAGPAKVGPRS
ncbi:inositol monophosphatase family protein [Acuticoccus sp. I52.16.1]|uniref:inositol monophosphatase family protein n=1 Tax=Acuticoccus sp. I52.16.1 TaxID=2928472 RepID=UPI001FD1EF8E|nr:inositol monophosphatase family protein [Acuticoccus sp. I52.16.1]UOM33742.1 inositol monophosphatase [Acuticoccus sp. I52.16.1]